MICEEAYSSVIFPARCALLTRSVTLWMDLLLQKMRYLNTSDDWSQKHDGTVREVGQAPMQCPTEQRIIRTSVRQGCNDIFVTVISSASASAVGKGVGLVAGGPARRYVRPRQYGTGACAWPILHSDLRSAWGVGVRNI